MIADDFKEAPVAAGILHRARKQRLGETLNRCERRLEFMRDVGDKILAHALQPPQFGHVMQHHNRSGRLFRHRRHNNGGAGDACFERLYRRGRNRKRSLLHEAHRDVGLQSLLALQHPADQPQQGRIADHFDHRPPFDRRCIQVQDFRERAVRENDPLLRVDHGHALDHASQDGARAVALAAQRTNRSIHRHRRFIQGVGQFGKFIA